MHIIYLTWKQAINHSSDMQLLPNHCFPAPSLFAHSYLHPTHIFRKKLWFSVTVVAFKCVGMRLFTFKWNNGYLLFAIPVALHVPPSNPSVGPVVWNKMTWLWSMTQVSKRLPKMYIWCKGWGIASCLVFIRCRFCCSSQTPLLLFVLGKDLTRTVGSDLIT